MNTPKMGGVVEDLQARVSEQGVAPEKLMQKTAEAEERRKTYH